MNTKHRNVRNWSARLAIVAAGAALTSAASPSQAKLLGLSEQDEIRAGQQVAAQAQREYGRALPASDAMARRVNAIGRRFANISQRRNIPYTYTVLQNEKVLNAFAAPGGPIFVTTKLVRTTANDAELAYVLGHETAHIERRHIAESVEKQQKVGIGVGILGAILGRRANSNVVGTIAGIGMKVWESGYSRKQEDDSDAVGVRMMARLGYDPRAAATMLRKLDEGGGSRGGLDKYLASHPAPASRIAKVNAQIQKENLLDIARRSGGPRLSDGGSYGSGGGYAAGYGDDYGTGAGSGDAYPDDDYSTNGGRNSGSTSYPDYNNDRGNDRNTDYDNGRGTGRDYGSDDERGEERVADLGGPLRIIEQGDSSVILASAAGVARWAGATARNRGNALVLTRGGRTLELRRNSTVAFENGQRRDMSVAAAVYDGRLYAPLGDLVEGLGGRARFDQRLNAVRLEIDGRESVISLRER